MRHDAQRPRPGAVATLTRDQYAARLAAGQRFRDAGLYERDHAPREAEFFHVQLTPKLSVYKRRTA